MLDTLTHRNWSCEGHTCTHRGECLVTAARDSEGPSVAEVQRFACLRKGYGTIYHRGMRREGLQNTLSMACPPSSVGDGGSDPNAFMNRVVWLWQSLRSCQLGHVFVSLPSHHLRILEWFRKAIPLGPLHLFCKTCCGRQALVAVRFVADS